MTGSLDLNSEEVQYDLLCYIFSKFAHSFEYSRDDERKYTNAIVMSMYVLDIICNKKKSYHYRFGIGSGNRSILSIELIKKLWQKLIDEGYILNNQEFFLRIPPFDDGSFVLDSWAKSLGIDKVNCIKIQQSLDTLGTKTIEFSNGENTFKIEYDFKINNAQPKNESDKLSLIDFYKWGKINDRVQYITMEWNIIYGEVLEFEFFGFKKECPSLGKFNFKLGKFRQNDKVVNKHKREISPKYLLSSFLFSRDYDKKKESSRNGKTILTYIKEGKVIEEDNIEKDCFTRIYYDELPVHGPFNFSIKNKIATPAPSNEKDINKLFKNIGNDFGSWFSVFVKDCFSTHNIFPFGEIDYIKHDIPMIKQIVLDTLNFLLTKPGKIKQL